MAALAWGGWIRKLLTWGTVWVEGSFAILVCIRRTRMMAVASIVLLHLGIAIFIPGVTFFTLCMALAATLYVPAETYHRAAAWIVNRQANGVARLASGVAPAPRGFEVV